MDADVKALAANLDHHGVIRILAERCASAMRSAAAAATPESFIHLVTHQVAATGDPSPEAIAAHLHTTLTALEASASELLWAEHAGRA